MSHSTGGEKNYCICNAFRSVKKKKKKLLSLAERLAAKKPNVKVAWDSVGNRAVELISEDMVPTRELWGALFAAESEAMTMLSSPGPVDIASSPVALISPRSVPRASPVPFRVDRSDLFLLSNMPEHEKLCLVSSSAQPLSGVFGSRPSGRCVVYVCMSCMRINDNAALQYAHRVARSFNLPLLCVMFSSPPAPPSSFAPTCAALDATNEVEEDYSSQCPHRIRWQQCMASAQSNLQQLLNIPTMTLRGPFSVHALMALLRDLSCHVASADWRPDPDMDTVMQRVSELGQDVCPVMWFDSSFWSVRHHGIVAQDVRQRCEMLMTGGNFLMRGMPHMQPLNPMVQCSLYAEGDAAFQPQLFVPPSFADKTCALPVVVESTFGIEAANKALDGLCGFLADKRSNDVKMEKILEVRDGNGCWSMLRFVELGCVSAAEVLRRLNSHRPPLEARRKRLAFEVLVWSREQTYVWWTQQRRMADCVAPERLDVDIVEEKLMQEASPLWRGIHARFMRDGVIHPLLLPHYLSALPDPRWAVARALFERYCVCGWMYGMECWVRFTLAQGEPLQTPQQMAAIASLLKE